MTRWTKKREIVSKQICDILKSSGRDMTSNEIAEKIEGHFKGNVNAATIGSYSNSISNVFKYKNPGSSGSVYYYAEEERNFKNNDILILETSLKILKDANEPLNSHIILKLVKKILPEVDIQSKMKIVKILRGHENITYTPGRPGVYSLWEWKSRNGEDEDEEEDNDEDKDDDDKDKEES